MRNFSDYVFKTVNKLDCLPEGSIFRFKEDGYFCRLDYVTNRRMECHILEILKDGSRFVVPRNEARFMPSVLVYERCV